MFLKNENGVYCLGLFGMGGLGKTTMCKELCSYFTDKVHRPLPIHRVCHLEIGSNHTDIREMKEMKFKRHIKILRELSDVPEDQIDKLEKTHAENLVSSWSKHPGVKNRTSRRYNWPAFWCTIGPNIVTYFISFSLFVIHNHMTTTEHYNLHSKVISHPWTWWYN